MLPKYIWSFLWTAAIFEAALASPTVPSDCTITSFQLLCSSFYVKTLDKCISNSMPSDIFVKENQICYVVHPERCIEADFCPQARAQAKPKDDDVTTTTTSTASTTPKATANGAMPNPEKIGGTVDQPGIKDDNVPVRNEDAARTRETEPLDEEWPLKAAKDDDPTLLTPLGLILFWTQFGLGLGLFLGLVIAIGLLIWCKNKNKHRPAPRADPEQPEQHRGQTEPKPEEDLCTERRPAISGPINNLNSAWDEPEGRSHSEGEESIYNEPLDDTDPDQKNPFQGWAFSSSFRPVGPPPPPPPEAIPMVVRPVARMNQSTMTDYPRPKETLSKGAYKGRSDIRSGYMASPESSLERRSAGRIAGARPKQQQQKQQQQQQQDNNSKRSKTSVVHQGCDDGPTYNLPPLPVRTSSLRHKKRERKRNNATDAATLS